MDVMGGGAPAWAVLLLCVGFPYGVNGASEQNPAEQSQKLSEVVVTAPREIDPRTLDRVVIPKFVRLHGVASESIDQLARWREQICPTTKGLEPRYDDFVSKRVVALARSVGAPAAGAANCRTNIEVLFTHNPQGELDDVAKNRPLLLGGSSGQTRPSATFTHPIQAWYVTATHSYVVPTASTNGTTYDHGDAPKQGPQIWVMTSTHSPLPVNGSRQIDSPAGGDFIRGEAGSLLTAGLSSEFVNVLIVIDSGQVSQYSLAAIADYVAMLALTRTSLDGCNELPSVIDVFSPDCRIRAAPASITSADSAYLKALYSANLEMRLNVELGELQDRMVHEFESR
jgi:hypothetical protein